MYEVTWNGSVRKSLENTDPVEPFKPFYATSDDHYSTYGKYGELVEMRYMKHKISKSFWVDGMEFYLTIAAARKGAAQKVCADKGMMLFEPRNQRIHARVTEIAKQAGLKRYWLNIQRKAETITGDPAQEFYYESDESSLTWDKWAFGYPSNSASQVCAMVGYLTAGYNEWASAPCENTAGDIICQELPKTI